MSSKYRCLKQCGSGSPQTFLPSRLQSVPIFVNRISAKAVMMAGMTHKGEPPITAERVAEELAKHKRELLKPPERRKHELADGTVVETTLDYASRTVTQKVRPPKAVKRGKNQP